VLLNTELPGEESMITGIQLSWLAAELDKKYRYKFVFLHEPDQNEAARDRLHKLFIRKGVSLVVSGHDHMYSRSRRNGIIYVTAPRMGEWVPPSFHQRTCCVWAVPPP
jgi:hypothetical protein